MVANGFVELVKSRNRMAKALGYLDYYDYKVTQAEGFGKVALFEILDTLEQGTRPLMLAARKRFEAEKGAANLQPWNMGFAMAGDVTKKLCARWSRPLDLWTTARLASTCSRRSHASC